MSVALSCQSIVKRLGDKTVLQSLDLSVAPGEIVTLLGASGSGKTTLLRIIAGLYEPDEGSIDIGPYTVWGKGQRVPPERRRVAMVFQDYALWPHMNVINNITFGLKAQKLAQNEIAKRLTHALQVTKLQDFSKRFPNELSGGQQQRVAIARCLAARPLLMLFDEPLSNLDAALRDDLRNEMVQLVKREGITALYVTHDQAEAMAVSDRIAVMREGTIAQLDTPEKLYQNPADSFVASFIGGFSLLPGKCYGTRFEVDGPEAQCVTVKNQIDGNCYLVIRPEDARPANSDRNQFYSTVTSCTFQGRCWRLTVDVDSKSVRIDWPHKVLNGSRLVFALDPKQCLLVKP